MKIEIDFTDSLEGNANNYYALSKKAKKKLAGLGKGVAKVKSKIASEEKNKTVQKKLVKKREKKWYEKFHWFFTSGGLLVLSGRDAHSNEIIVKKIMEQDDVYFHADIQGAPHTIIKTNGVVPSKEAKQEAAIFAAVFSKAWREQIPGIDVYSASPNQVSKNAPSGEALGTGAFMISGKREWFKKTPLEFAIGVKKGSDSEFCSGPIKAIKANCSSFVEISLGSDSKGVTSKKIRSIFFKKLKKGEINLDDLSALLPSGGIKVVPKSI